MSLDGVLRAKFLFTLAQEQLASRHPLAPGATVSLLQDAVEAMAHSAAAKVGAKTRPTMSFHEYWKEVAKVPGCTPLPYETAMGDLNQARVGFKHRGVVPKNAERYTTDAHLFLTETTRLYFALEFDSISEVEMIQDPSVRKTLKEAQSHLASGELEKCLERCKDAADSIDGILHAVMPTLVQAKLRGSDAVTAAIAEVLNAMQKQFRFVQDYVALLSIGVDPLEFIVARALLPMKSLGGTYHFGRTTMSPDINQESVASTVQILVRIALRFESTKSRLEDIGRTFRPPQPPSPQ